MAVHADFEHEVQAVYAVLIDPKYLVDRNLALGELSAECEVEQDGDCVTITAVREVRRKLPGVLARIFDPDSTLDMTEEWRAEDDGWRGHWTMKVREQPVTIMGSFQLLPTPGGCRYSVSHKVQAKVPLVSMQVRKFILGQTTKGARDELEYLRTYLD